MVDSAPARSGSFSVITGVEARRSACAPDHDDGDAAREPLDGLVRERGGADRQGVDPAQQVLARRAAMARWTSPRPAARRCGRSCSRRTLEPDHERRAAGADEVADDEAVRLLRALGEVPGRPAWARSRAPRPPAGRGPAARGSGVPIVRTRQTVAIGRRRWRRRSRSSRSARAPSNPPRRRVSAYEVIGRCPDPGRRRSADAQVRSGRPRCGGRTVRPVSTDGTFPADPPRAPAEGLAVARRLPGGRGRRSRSSRPNEVRVRNEGALRRPVHARPDERRAQLRAALRGWTR